MAELPDEQDQQDDQAGQAGLAGLAGADAWVWGLGWWLACLAVWGMVPVWVPRPVWQACTRRYARGSAPVAGGWRDG